MTKRPPAPLAPAVQSRNRTPANSRKRCSASLEDAKAEDIVSVDLRGKTTLADLMIVATGQLQRHMFSAIATIASSKSVQGGRFCRPAHRRPAPQRVGRCSTPSRRSSMSSVIPRASSANLNKERCRRDRPRGKAAARLVSRRFCHPRSGNFHHLASAQFDFAPVADRRDRRRENRGQRTLRALSQAARGSPRRPSIEGRSRRVKSGEEPGGRAALNPGRPAPRRGRSRCWTSEGAAALASTLSIVAIEPRNRQAGVYAAVVIGGGPTGL